MKGTAEFHLIGRVGRIAQLAGVTKITVASDDPRRDEQGEWRSNTAWNEATVFGEKTQGWVNAQLQTGDLVQIRGRIRQGRYDKNGATVYTVDLIATEVNRLARKAESGDQPEHAPHTDDDIPF